MGISPTSSRNSVPTSCLLDESLSSGTRIGECALRVSKELTLRECLRDRSTIDWNEGSAIAPPIRVNGSRHELLPTPTLAHDQDRHVRNGDTSDGIEQALHRGALADHMVEHAGALDSIGQKADLLDELLVLQRAIQRDLKDLRLDRLRDEVIGAGANRGYRALEAAEGGHDDDGYIAAALHDPAAHLDSVDTGHLQIGQNDVDLSIERLFEHALCPSRVGRVPAAALEVSGQKLTKVAVVVDDQDAAHPGQLPVSSDAQIAACVPEEV